MTAPEPNETATRGSAWSRIAAWRAAVRRLPGGFLVWRVAITVAGTLVIVAGVVLLPLPGPGWLVIFLGLGLLATEYEWAARLLRWGRQLVLRWTDWAGRQPPLVRVVIGVGALVFLAALAFAAWRIYVDL
ncbi:MAG TPA: TIGR02611 family protein [Jatrophihabitantaceae bacterium]